MARLAKNDIHKALEKAAGHIRAAAGEDGITSRADIRRKLGTLEGTERALVDIFYRFMDRRDAKPGARITESDISGTLAYAKDRLIDQYDLNRNGLSKAEIEKMSTTGKLAVALARQLKKEAVGDTNAEGKKLSLKLGELAEGLWFDQLGSEAAIELKSFFAEASLTELTEDTFSQTLNLDPNDVTQVIERFITPDAEFYEQFLDVNDHADSAEDLIDLMKASLKDIRVIVLGRDNAPEVGSEHPTYWVGIARDGSLVGLETFVVWT